MPDRDPAGWSSYAPDTVGVARTVDPHREFTIDKERDGSYSLTVLDPVEERGEVTNHATIEDAKREAARLSGDPDLRWLMLRE